MHATILCVGATASLALAASGGIGGLCRGNELSTADRAAAASAKRANEPVLLKLSKVSARRDASDAIFECDAAIENHSGAVINVSSAFGSPFDGLELVVLDSDGGKLVQQPYTSHQSPSLAKKRFPLQIGENRRSLNFPVDAIPKGADKVGVLLIGTLPGSVTPRTLCSNLVTITIERDASAAEHGAVSPHDRLLLPRSLSDTFGVGFDRSASPSKSRECNAR